MKKLIHFITTILLTVSLSGCKNENKIIIGASSTPHAEILEFIKSDYESLGYNLEIKIFNDYVTPNLSLDSGDIQMNYFQHEPYLNDFNANNGTSIVSVAKIHFEPLGVYKGRKSNLSDYESGDTIAIPNDTSNKARAIDLLNELGITNYTALEMEAQAIPMVLQDVDFAVVNGNYALASSITNKVLATEDKNSAIVSQVANVIAVKSGNENKQFVLDLISVLKTQKVKDFIEEKYGSSVIAVW